MELVKQAIIQGGRMAPVKGLVLATTFASVCHFAFPKLHYIWLWYCLIAAVYISRYLLLVRHQSFIKHIPAQLQLPVVIEIPLILTGALWSVVFFKLLTPAAGPAEVIISSCVATGICSGSTNTFGARPWSGSVLATLVLWPLASYCLRASDSQMLWVLPLLGLYYLTIVATLFKHHGSKVGALKMSVEKDRTVLELDTKLGLLDRILKSSPDALIFADPNLVIEKVSHSTTKIFEISESELLGQTTERLYANPGDYQVSITSRFTPKNHLKVDPYTVEYKNSRGEIIVGETIGQALTDEAGTLLGYLYSIRDVTKQKETEKQLERERAKVIQSSKLSAMGEMAAGLAHEINNPLAIIDGLMSTLLKLYEKRGEISISDVKRTYGHIHEAVERTSQIISGLKTFSRDARHDPVVPVRLSRVVESTLGFCQARFRHHEISIQVDIQDGLFVQAREVHLSQVLLNLLGNAFDAHSNEGEELHDRYVKISAKVTSGGEQISVRVEDNGPGIPLEVKNQVMDPFFTTKPVGKGTGLGLSISKGLVEDMGGKLKLVRADSPTIFEIGLQGVEVEIEKERSAS